jgi:anthranilate phosphoribosyltransferase
MKHILAHLAQGQHLSAQQADEAFQLIMTGQATAAQIGAFLAFLQTRHLTVDEMSGFLGAMRAKAIHVTVPPDLTVVDTCGTGGDLSGTFNISTAAAFIVAGAGKPRSVAVTKHGNRSLTSTSGSSQVLETLGVKLRVSESTHVRCMREAGIAFFFAPLHHPAMKHAAPIRQELGFRTVFNLIGPLTNPANAKRQLFGIYDPSLTEPVARSLAAQGTIHAMVVHGHITETNSGLDEISTMGPTRISHIKNGRVETYSITPGDLGFPIPPLASLKVSTPQESAVIIREFLSGKPGPARDITCLNAGAALLVADLVPDLKSGMALAAQSIDSGQALASLKSLIQITQSDDTP